MTGPIDFKKKKIITGPTSSYIKQLTWDAGRSPFTNSDIDFGCGCCLCKS